ncbi:hypothetical protein [Deinococcus sp. AJ005]|uniref:hypothetical protein n=1 Tax=Deinococcus sp. AJ005 TaxID=2652443 RepID=UPI00125CAE85|nr:hypothetical protein [Deinococcus sp. AJ005]QFP77752.1 hypothetical protein DAAJ005_15815 [Deinococcus sp. AJ005]
MDLPSFLQELDIDASTKEKLVDIYRLAVPMEELNKSKYVNGEYLKNILDNSIESLAEIYSKSTFDVNYMSIFFPAMFDFLCNGEYLRNRVVNSNWIYCPIEKKIFFSFLKQCPDCSVKRGLHKRIEKAQHKPSSHHIGEICNSTTMLIIDQIVKNNDKNLNSYLISKQSHNVDSFVSSSEILVLMELKSSPMVSFPLELALADGLTEDLDGNVKYIDEHKLVSVSNLKEDFRLYFPNMSAGISLGGVRQDPWPLDVMADWIKVPKNLAQFLEAWQQIYDAYMTQKRVRREGNINLAYLSNGWGDEIDSNKTKPGLGRTDDLKKGTYQMIKFSAQYARKSDPNLVKYALVSNLDPATLFEEYLADIINLSIVDKNEISPIEKDRMKEEFVDYFDKYSKIPKGSPLNIFEAVIAMNKPMINDEKLKRIFSYEGIFSKIKAMSELQK